MKRGLISLIGSLVMAILVNYDIALGKQFTKNKSSGTLTVIEAPVKQGEIKEVKLPPVKKEPPFKVGDIIGYSEPGLPERYVGKVVVAVRWGKPGNWGKSSDEVGLFEREYENVRGERLIERWGPKGIEVDKEEGYIYILDTKNGRIQKYNQKGEYILSIFYYTPSDKFYGEGLYVNSNDVYVYEYPYTKEDFNKKIIRRYNGITGKFIKAYQYEGPKKFGLLTSGIYLDNDILYTHSGGEIVCKSDSELEKKPKKKVYRIHLHQKDLKVINREYMKIDIKFLKQLKSISKDIEKDEIFIKLPFGSYASVSYTPPIIKNTDKLGNIYILFGDLSENKLNPQFEMYKYTIKGELLAKIRLKKDNWLTYRYIGSITIDNAGNIYELWTCKQGVYVIKWTKY